MRGAGSPASESPPHELRRRIGHVFQRLGLFPHLTVAENIAVIPSLLGWGGSRIRARADALLERCELDPAAVRDRRPDESSRAASSNASAWRARSPPSRA